MINFGAVFVAFSGLGIYLDMQAVKCFICSSADCEMIYFVFQKYMYVPFGKRRSSQWRDMINWFICVAINIYILVERF